MTNVVALVGRLTRPAAPRLLPSGDRLLELEVRVDGPGGRAESVPVVWPDFPAWASGLDTETAVTVVGRVRRRFFRVAGTTRSRTEVVADRVVPQKQAKRALAALADAVGRIDGG